jgi:ubiquinone biosynthesis protein
VKIPSLLERSEQALATLEDASANGFRLSADSAEAIGRAEAHRARWGHIALWIIAAALVAFLFK